MSWPRDDAKLDRVRALMADEDLDALVVRAPDNVLYLSNFWGMKGYDAVVFPREGEPMLIALEPSRDDVERTAWTADVRLFAGYDERDPRPPTARALDLARDAARPYERIGLELSPRHAGGRPHGRRADDLHPRLVRRVARRGRRDAAPRRGPRAQDRAGGRADAARERDRRRGDGARARAPPPGDEGEPGRRALERASSTARAPAGRARSSSRTASRSSGRARDPDVHGHRRPAGAGARADAVRDLGLRRRLLVRPHEERLPGRADARSTTACSSSCSASTRRPSTTAVRARASPSSTSSSASGIADAGYPGQPSHPIAHGVGARAHEPPYAHQAGGGTVEEGMVLAIEPGIYWEGGGGLRLEDNFLITADGAEKLSSYPDDFR